MAHPWHLKALSHRQVFNGCLCATCVTEFCFAALRHTGEDIHLRWSSAVSSRPPINNLSCNFVPSASGIVSPSLPRRTGFTVTCTLTLYGTALIFKHVIYHLEAELCPRQTAFSTLVLCRLLPAEPLNLHVFLCLPCLRPDFDANNIFRAFFSGHGGGFSFDSPQGVFLELSWFCLKQKDEPVYLSGSFLFSPPSSRFWTREFLFPVRLRRKIKHVGMWRLTEDGINLDSYDTSSCKKKCNITKTKKNLPLSFSKDFRLFRFAPTFTPHGEADRLLEFWFRSLTQQCK